MLVIFIKIFGMRYRGLFVGAYGKKETIEFFRTNLKTLVI